MQHVFVKKFLRKTFADYKDIEICDLLEFGFPIGYIGNDNIFEKGERTNLWKHKNHTGATELPDSMLGKEVENNSILGTFKSNHFTTQVKISPVNSLPKRYRLESFWI